MDVPCGEAVAAVSMVRDRIPGDAILIALVGSHAYGTERPDSDRDFRGVFVAPTARILGWDKPAETVDRRDPDMALYEIEKFMRLAAKANPSIMEVLWAPPLIMSPWGKILRDRRSVFLSRRAYNTYGGYAIAQLRKAEAGSGGSRGQKHLKREKFILHTYRLMECGIHLLREGNLKLRVDDPEMLWAKTRLPIERVVRDMDRLRTELDAARAGSPLPEEPDAAALEQLLLAIRNAH